MGTRSGRISPSSMGIWGRLMMVLPMAGRCCCYAHSEAPSSYRTTQKPPPATQKPPPLRSPLQLPYHLRTGLLALLRHLCLYLLSNSAPTVVECSDLKVGVVILRRF
eukprot:7784489-Pyramimonas_sp.AAC.2